MKTLLFKVEHGDWSAELQLPAVESLEELANAIIKAVGFEMDHCYGFYNKLKQYFDSTEEYTLFSDIGEDCTESDTGVQGTCLADVFHPEKKMLFLFDYGDDWMFPLVCTGEMDTKPFKRPKLLSTKGVPPEQYPDFAEGT